MKNTKKLTKKAFKEYCSFHVYTNTTEKHNVIYFDWKVCDTVRGYKYGIASRTKLIDETCTKKQLFDYLYNWVVNDITDFPYYVRTKFAQNDNGRFRIPLALNF